MRLSSSSNGAEWNRRGCTSPVWLGDHRRAYADEQFAKLRDAGLADAFHYAGSVDRAGKIEFLKGIDVLSVPTVYHEPKGLFVLEALAAGVPVVQPSHGAFPELVAATGGGRLVRPEDPAQLADELHALLSDEAMRRNLGRQGMAAVHKSNTAAAMAQSALAVYERFLAPQESLQPSVTPRAGGNSERRRRPLISRRRYSPFPRRRGNPGQQVKALLDESSANSLVALTARR